MNDFCWPHISLYGDSLSFPRPGVLSKQERYIHLVRGALMQELNAPIDLRERGGPSNSVVNLQERILQDEAYFQDRGLLAVLQSGIVDCAPRPISQSTRDLIDRHLPDFLKRWVISYLHRNRAKMLLRRVYQVTPLPLFRIIYTDCVRAMTKANPSSFCINICPAPASFESKSPGVSSQITAYNEVIQEAVVAYEAQGAKLIDVHGMISGATDVYDYIVREDDHHITALTHRWIAQAILRGLGKTALAGAIVQ